MKDDTSDKPDLPKQNVSSPLTQFVIGQLKQSQKNGELLVECNGCEPKPARLLASMNRSELQKKAGYGQEVLVVFAHDNPDEPVIVGVMGNILEETVYMEDGHSDALADRERVVIRAEKEVVLACGDSSITLTRDGRIVVRGREILSRASGSNKIKGSHIEFN